MKCDNNLYDKIEYCSGEGYNFTTRLMYSLNNVLELMFIMNSCYIYEFFVEFFKIRSNMVDVKRCVRFSKFSLLYYYEL